MVESQEVESQLIIQEEEYTIDLLTVSLVDSIIYKLNEKIKEQTSKIQELKSQLSLWEEGAY